MPRKSRKTERPFQKPRGMRDLYAADFYRYQGFFEKAAEIAIYYGFKPIETPIAEREEVFTSGVGTDTDIVEKEMYTLRVRGGEKLALRPEGTAPVMRAYIEGGLHAQPQPVMLYHYGPYFRHDKPQRGRYRQFHQFGIEVLGTGKSVADAVVIRIAMLILGESGFSGLCVMINSIGEKDCRPEYVKELTSYYRKHINALCANCRQRIKTNPLRLLDCKEEKCREFKDEAPQMVDFLCGQCKTHFKEVLEYLDTMEIPYRIDHSLVRGIDYYTRTVFEIVNDEESCGDEKERAGKKDQKSEDAAQIDGKTADRKPEPEEAARLEPDKAELVRRALAGGGRYDELGEQLGSKKAVPATGAALGVDRIIEAPEFRVHAPRVVKKPKVFFIQLGFEAKLKSLKTIEVLRGAKIPVMHSLSKDRLSVQLAMAERSAVPTTLILGQKEALEDAVIVRNMATRSQETVKIDALAEYLKKRD